MSAPGRTEPSYVPIRTGGWPARRAPRWLLAVAAVLLAIAIAVALVHRPSRGQRAADLAGFLQSMTYDIQSCAGGVHDSLTALRAIDSGTSRDTATAVTIAGTGAANCSPANNELIDDLESYQVPESLASFHLGRAVTGFIDWAAPDAEQAQADVAAVLRDRGTPAEAGDRTVLRQALRKLDAQRAAIAGQLAPAMKLLTPRATAPALPG